MSEGSGQMEDGAGDQRSRRKFPWKGVLLFTAGFVACPALLGFWVLLQNLLFHRTGTASPKDLVRGGEETEAMRSALIERGVLEPEEALLWSGFWGGRLGSRGCVLTEERLGIFLRKQTATVQSGAPVLFMAHEDVRLVEVDWQVRGMPHPHLRLHDDRGSWLQLQLRGDSELSQEFVEELAELCEERSQGAFEGLVEIDMDLSPNDSATALRCYR